MSASLRSCNVKDGIQLHVIISRDSFRREGEIVRGFTGGQLGLTSTDVQDTLCYVGLRVEGINYER